LDCLTLAWISAIDVMGEAAKGPAEGQTATSAPRSCQQAKSLMLLRMRACTCSFTNMRFCLDGSEGGQRKAERTNLTSTRHCPEVHDLDLDVLYVENVIVPPEEEPAAHRTPKILRVMSGLKAQALGQENPVF
jgi:hypothetical protein